MYCVIKTLIGNLKIEEETGFITGISFTEEAVCLSSSMVLKTAAAQLNEYFSKQRKTFDLPLKFHGTDFQKKVWKVLLEIPYGSVRSYKEIAISIGNEKAARAVGMANHKNPIMIVVPCHRVIGSNGAMTGYAYGIDMKEKLLELEGILKR